MTNVMQPLLGTIAFQQPKGGTLALDGTFTAGAVTGAGPLTNSLGFSNSLNDTIIVVMVLMGATSGGSYTTGSVTDTAGLSWTMRKRLEYTTDAAPITMEIWWAHAPTPVSSDTISVALTGSTPDISIMGIFGVNGCDVAAPWDTNVGLPYTNNAAGGSSNPEIASVDTTNADAFIFGFVGGNSFPVSVTPTYSGGFANLGAVGNSSGQNDTILKSMYEIFSSAQSGLTAEFIYGSPPPNWALIVDALKN